MTTRDMVYIDLDGVLARWQLHEVSRQVGRKITEDDWSREHGWDIVSVIQELGGPDYRERPMDFWNSVTEESWASTPRTNDFGAILSGAVKLVGQDSIRICTAPPPDHNPAAYSGKAKWIKNCLPTWLHRSVVFTEHKSDLAAPNRLLIDDADHNDTAWRDAGGPCMLIPRPWNRNDGIPMDAYLMVSFSYMGYKWRKETNSNPQSHETSRPS